MNEAVLIPCGCCQSGRTATERHRLFFTDGFRWEKLVCAECSKWSRNGDNKYNHPANLKVYEPLIYPYANPEHDVMIELFCIAVARLLIRSDEDVAILRAAGDAARRERRVA